MSKASLAPEYFRTKDGMTVKKKTTTIWYSLCQNKVRTANLLQENPEMVAMPVVISKAWAIQAEEAQVIWKATRERVRHKQIACSKWKRGLAG